MSQGNVASLANNLDIIDSIAMQFHNHSFILELSINK